MADLLDFAMYTTIKPIAWVEGVLRRAGEIHSGSEEEKVVPVDGLAAEPSWRERGEQAKAVEGVWKAHERIPPILLTSRQSLRRCDVGRWDTDIPDLASVRSEGVCAFVVLSENCRLTIGEHPELWARGQQGPVLPSGLLNACLPTMYPPERRTHEEEIQHPYPEFDGPCCVPCGVWAESGLLSFTVSRIDPSLPAFYVAIRDTEQPSPPARQLAHKLVPVPPPPTYALLDRIGRRVVFGRGRVHHHVRIIAPQAEGWDDYRREMRRKRARREMEREGAIGAAMDTRDYSSSAYLIRSSKGTTVARSRGTGFSILTHRLTGMG
jgi:hypothetical protein